MRTRLFRSTGVVVSLPAAVLGHRPRCRSDGHRSRYGVEAGQPPHPEVVGRRTVTRHLAALGLNRRRFIHPNGDTNREPQKIIAFRPGHMVHMDVKKVGRIPAGGGWRIHRKNSDHARTVARNKKTEHGGYVYLHSALDGYSRLAYTEALPDEKATTAIGFINRARAWFAAHGIRHIERIVTANGACYRADAFARALLGSRHQRIAPYTPRHNGNLNATTESSPRNSCTPRLDL